ncbi:MAG TPA: class I SAM-dependent methyltransferase [Ignavibacteriaceae bacterium]|nr:class I SAM-dependent methyltransferase [Ignavibacteriaceae bacterium]
MDKLKLNNYPIREGIYIVSDIRNQFESVYLKLRESEKRIYSDGEVRNLPSISDKHLHFQEWKLRSKSLERFRAYLNSYERNLNFLDIGCGNGWFCGQLSRLYHNNFYCIDINLTELKQAGRVFNNGRIKFIYADIFSAELPEKNFDLITIVAAVQYFPNLKKLIERLQALISERGEIHIIDSPFYNSEEVDAAKKRTFEYYTSIGFPEMANNYFHHSREDLSAFNYEVLFDPNTMLSKVKKVLMIKDSPFPWIIIRK